MDRKAYNETMWGSPALKGFGRIVLLPGDGIGPEIMNAAKKVLRKVGDFKVDEHLVGGASIDASRTALTDQVLEACRSADAVLLAAVGGPKWDTTDPEAPRSSTRAPCARTGSGTRTSSWFASSPAASTSATAAGATAAPSTPASTASRRSS